MLNKSLRVLIVSHSLPRFPGSGAETRAFCLVRELARDFDITCLLPDYGSAYLTEINALRAICRVDTYSFVPQLNWLQWRLHDVQRLARQLNYWWPLSRSTCITLSVSDILPALTSRLQGINWQDYDIFHVIHPHLASVLRYVEVQVPKTVDWIDERTTTLKREASVSSLFRRAFILIEIQRVKEYQKKIASHCDITFISSDTDADRMQNIIHIKRPVVVPNAIDPSYFQNPSTNRPPGNTLIFSGHMSYLPNVDAVHFLCQAILPYVVTRVPDVQLLVVGTQPHPSLKQLEKKSGGRMLVTGEVPDVRPYFLRSAISVAPLRNGAGTRLKILEALVMHRPVVTTTIGCEGLNLANGCGVLIRDDPETFAQAIVDLLHDILLWQQLANLGQTIVYQTYTWQQSATHIMNAWSELVRSPFEV